MSFGGGFGGFGAAPAAPAGGGFGGFGGFAAPAAPAAPPPPDRGAQAQLVQLAQQFWAAYSGALAAPNAAQLGALYGADSVLSFDGQVAEGQANILAQVLTPRLAAGGIRINLTKIEVQPVKTTDQVLLLLTGEASQNPPGRFSQAIVLQPAGGSMYVKLDVVRFGAGAAPQNVARDPAGMALGFLQSYFGAMAQNKQALAPAFRENSELTIESQHFRGLREIQVKLAAVPPREGEDAAAAGFVKPVPDGRRDMHSLDALPLVAPAAAGAAPAALLALVTGAFTGAGEANALPFAQAFVLLNDASGSYCGDDIFLFAL